MSDKELIERIEKLEEKIEKIEKKLLELDNRTFGSVRFGGALL